MQAAFTVFPDRAALMQAAAERLAAAIDDALRTRGAACAALSGGSTPAPVYRALAQRTGWSWNDITFALVDERFVPAHDEASNERLLRETLAPAFAGGAPFKPMYFATPTAAEAAARANDLYNGLRIDVALMGMGADGHTASWFPGAAGLDDALDLANSRVVTAVHAPSAAGSPDRLTLTRTALARAGRVILLITGDDKRARLEAALAGAWAPVAALFEAPMPTPEVLWAP